MPSVLVKTDNTTFFGSHIITRLHSTQEGYFPNSPSETQSMCRVASVIRLHFMFNTTVSRKKNPYFSWTSLNAELNKTFEIQDTVKQPTKNL